MNYSSGLKRIRIATLHLEYTPFLKIWEAKISGRKYLEDIICLNLEGELCSKLSQEGGKSHF